MILLRRLLLGLALAGPSALPALAAPEAADQVAAAIRQAALAIAPPDASLSLGSVAGAAAMQSCTVPLSVTISGVAPYEQAEAHCAVPAWTLYVTVTVAQSQSVVVATRPLVAGQSIGPGDVALKDEPVSLYAGRQVFYDPTQLAGDQAVMSLAAGAILVAQDITEPVVVKAGETVTVQVINGGVTISVNAVADETGRIGDTILLTNPSSGRRFSAQVTANGPVVRLQS